MASDIAAIPFLGASDVHVWRIELFGDADRYVALLSAQEHTRLKRLRAERQEAFAISHGAMREVLGAYLGCAPVDVPLSSPYGQPPGLAGLELSLTHCDDLALLAVSLMPVGVDVEMTTHVPAAELAKLAKQTLTAAELRQFQRAPAGDQLAMWLRSWVRKEAVLKALRRGLGDQPLCRLDVSGDDVEGLTLLDLDLGASHLAAVAIRHCAPRVTITDWIRRSG